MDKKETNEKMYEFVKEKLSKDKEFKNAFFSAILEALNQRIKAHDYSIFKEAIDILFKDEQIIKKIKKNMKDKTII